MLVTIIIVAIIFTVLVVIHELGHFWAAKRAGVSVEEFGLGFPPRIAKIKRAGTVWSLNLIPIGGFVRLKGEDGGNQDKDSFGLAKYSQKAKILLAGVGMNLLLAYLILVGLCFVGLPPVFEGQYSLGNPTYSEQPKVLVAGVEPGSPADKAGLKRGDVIIQIADEPIKSAEQLTRFTKLHAGERVEIVIERGNLRQNTVASLRGPENPSGYLGVAPFTTHKQRYGVYAPIVAGGLIWQMSGQTVAALGGMITGLVRSGKVSAEVAGPVGIVSIMASAKYLGLTYLWLFAALISLSLAIINALPLPALDGGRLALATYNRFSRKAVSPKVESIIHLTGFALLILLMIVVTISDIRRLN